MGKVLDAVLLVVWAAIFLGLCIGAPGVGVFLTAWGGIVILGFYNSYVRHDRGADRQGPILGRPMNHTQSLRAAWR
ncbi:hypothetical protein KO481_39630 [Nocardia sp. NEAU-G5]|uniref:Uncharacterized protein n=1 Tax=Nocardia albiluteola TaxID=2842303 RepID=A0ABS6BEH6_9NOCA|nr:hypothetical protein [Nocardia albiluteola]MBU3067618.1 hypothetical protein [Nocardia albiluteola]